jgi:hypothetical protein
MRVANCVPGAAMLLAVGCAKAQIASDAPPAPPADAAIIADASCGDLCDSDGDGVVDGMDQCPNTPAGAPVDKKGCADSQLTPMLNPNFPPYGLTWSHTGDPGRAGGLTWGYTGIDRGDLFHIYWLFCDDPSMPCGLSLDGPIDVPAESWTLSDTQTDLLNGKLVYTNAMHVVGTGGVSETVNGRLTITVTDGSAPIPFVNVAVLKVTARRASYGVEIKGTAFQAVVTTEVQDPSTQAWTPSLDWYDAQQTDADAGMPVFSSFDGAFYDK